MSKLSPTYAFIDAQNLILGTTRDKKPWKIDLRAFYAYLQNKYGVTKAFYFIGARDKRLKKLYQFIEKIGFEIVYREHDIKARGKKKGNVDTDVVFSVMVEIFVKSKPVKVVLVSGDGDYKKMVMLLIKKNKFRKILFPNRHWSSLYKDLDDHFFAKIYTPDMRKILELKK
jgi:uncharacterized LabA/DUF88 family protein